MPVKRKECDLVMKGGITSGVVYPTALVALHEGNEECAYDFRSIGGSSAGAIASAFAAAATFGVRTAAAYQAKAERGESVEALERGNPNAFKMLKELSSELSNPDFMSRTLQPNYAVKPIMDSIMAVLKRKREPKGPRIKIHELIRSTSPAPAVTLSVIAAILAIGLAALVGVAAQGRAGDSVPLAIVTVISGMASGVLGLPLGRWILTRILLARIPPDAASGSGAGARAGLGRRVVQITASWMPMVVPMFFVCVQAFLLGGYLKFQGAAVSYAALGTLAFLASIPAGLVGVVIGLLGYVKERYDNSETESFFGLTGAGQSDPWNPRGDSLTDWMHAKIQNLAGRGLEDKPLTFGDLEMLEPDVSLRFVTTNLSQLQPFIVPFDRNILLFNESEMRRMFPGSVVDHMVRNQHLDHRFELPEAFHFLPAARRNAVKSRPPSALPVLFGTRLSLSFPVLISGVPLYTVSASGFEKKKKGQTLVPGEDLLKNWFSDGGLSTNFPIHLFDSWIPTRPTFGISLGYKAKVAPAAAMSGQESPSAEMEEGTFIADRLEEPEDETDEDVDREKLSERVYLPRANQYLWAEWGKVSGLLGFLKSCFESAKDYRDSMQSRLPGYRDRIVEIRFGKGEGGINLGMDDKTVKDLLERGTEAGKKLLSDFEWEHHLWVRLLVLMCQLETQMASLKEPRRVESFRTARDIIQNNAGFPYPRPRRTDPDKETWQKEAERKLSRLEALVAEWGDTPTFTHEPPREKPVLRVTPPL